MKVYILTSSYNLYDQQGDYYVAVFGSLPTKDELKLHTGESYEDEDHYQHLLRGGGRVKDEDVWFNLIEENI